VTFRRRLIIFFALIVVLPMAAVALLVTQVADEWRTGKADARLDASMETALTVLDRALAASAADARAAGRDPDLARALRDRDLRKTEEAVTRLSRRLDLAALEVETPSGQTLARAGSPNALASAQVIVRDRDGRLGRVGAAGLSAARYSARVRDLTGREVAVFRGDQRLAATVELGGARLPEEEGTADIELPDGEVRVSTVAPDRTDPNLRLALFGSTGGAGLAATSPLVLLAVLAFLGIAVLCVILLVRALQSQVREMLAAARRVGGGDFSHRVPVEGNDEMAGLAREFNTMSERLSEQMAALRGQRAELERSVKRIGEAFAAALDRGALLEIVAETALAACNATAARAVLTGPRGLEAEAGERPAGELAEAIREAEEQALREGISADGGRANARAVAEPLGSVGGVRAGRAVLAIARVGEPFDSGQREMLRYLAAQAAVSLENIELHELISEGAVTDEVTGLATRHRFDELLDDEVERAARFGNELSLLLISVDDFRRMSNAHGHLQGNDVLREVARIVDGHSRGVDSAALYGRGEFAVALPETGAEGASLLAERILTAVRDTPISLDDGSGELLVTASIGIATFAGAADDAKGLVATARAALDRARAAGGDRAEVAHFQAGHRPRV
jgi:diguanylate cyclase (GGDEF)-like protein